MVDLLIENGANVSYRNENGVTPLDVAVVNGKLRGISIKYQIFFQMRHFCVAHPGNEQIVETLIAKGVNVNLNDTTGTTPLIEAIKHGSFNHSNFMQTYFRIFEMESQI